MIGLGIPAYFSPTYSPGDWLELAALDRGARIVVNPDSGPTRGMRAGYRRAVRASQRRGAVIYGYVDADYGRRSGRRVARDCVAYLTALGVDGIFLDQAPSHPDALARLARLMRPFRALGVRVGINPGQPDLPDVAFSQFDDVVVFEGDWATYRELPVGALGGEPCSAARWNLVYDVPDGRLGQMIERSHTLGADVIYATEGVLPNPWSALPADWARLVEGVEGMRLAAVVRPLAVATEWR